MKKNEPIYEYDKEGGVTTCILTYGQNIFLGIAQCHEDDKDMQNEYTGCCIALSRAKIEYFAHVRDHEIKPGLAALNQVYYTINRSKQFNPKSYEHIMLQRQIQQKENDLAVIKAMLTTEKQNLREFLEMKENFYKKIRKNRQ